MEGVGSAPKAKSRWCVRGRQDADAATLAVYAPAPQSESVMIACRAIASLGWKLNVADAKNALCQSNRLRRPAGATYVG
eukprot:3657577-Pyramimonas_sp.AAC.1